MGSNRWRRVVRRAKRLFAKAEFEAEMAEQMRVHQEMEAERNIAGGMTLREAREAAQRTFGHTDGIKEECREQSAWTRLEHLGQDLRFAGRSLRRKPAPSALALLTLSLAIGATTAIFSIADAVWFRPLPYAAAGELQTLRMMNRKTGVRFTLVGYDLMRALAGQNPRITGVGYGESVRGPVRVADQIAEQLSAAQVSANYFELLGVKAAKGRLFGPDDAAGPGRPAVLAYATWRDRFAADDAIVGGRVTLGGQSYDVAGVLPRDFLFPSPFIGNPEVVTIAPPPPADGPPNQGIFFPVLRRAAGVTREQETQRISALAQAVATRPEVKSGDVVPVLEDIGDILYPVGRPVMGMLLGAAGVVVLIGCANLGQMLRVKQRQRWHETRIRSALGANRLRLARPMIFEGLFLGVAGGAAGLIITALTLQALLRQVPAAAIRNAPAIGIDHRVVLFTFALACLAGLMTALAPALADARAGAPGAPPVARTRARFGDLMIAGQVALAVVLVFGTVAVAREFLSVLRVPLGFSPDNILVIQLPAAGDNGPARQGFYLQALRALRSRGDIASAGAAGSIPLDGAAPDEGIGADPGVEKKVALYHALPGYFETLGIRLIRGRQPTVDEVQAGADVAVLSETAARLLFPDRDPVGATITNGKGDRKFTVVGIVGDVLKSLDTDFAAPAYVTPGNATRRLTLVARASHPSYQMIAAIRRDLGALNPGQPVTVGWWTDKISGLTAYRNPRFQTLVLGSFSTLAVVLVAVGIFAIVGFLVTVREREFGIRMAIGATPRSLTVLVVRQTLLPVLAGLAGGLLLTRGTGGLMKAYLNHPGAGDALTFGATGLLILVAAILAAYLPARKAAKVDPMIALRAD